MTNEEAVKKILEHKTHWERLVHEHICEEKDGTETIEAFEKAISILTKAKTGYWIVDGAVDCYLEKARCHCSECGKKKQFPADYDPVKRELSISYKNPDFIDNYCPNCGAKMEAEE